MIKHTNEILRQLGLSEIESKIYQGMLAMGKTTVLDVSSTLNLNRVTTHDNISSLIEKGLVSQIKVGSRRALIAEAPEKLSFLIQQKEKSLVDLKKRYLEHIDELKKLIPLTTHEKTVNVRYYEGKHAVLGLYADSLRSDYVRSFVNIDRYYHIFPGTENIFKTAFDKNPKRQVWSIAVETPFAHQIEEDEEEKYPHYFCKYISEQEGKTIFNFASLVDYQIYSNKVAIIESDESNVTATLIESKLVYSSFEALHTFIWGLIP
jgi:sugar-specific transcriptional regulator TrmB